MQINLIIIDADFILWKTVPNKVISETEQMYGIKQNKTLKETLDLIDWYLKEKIFNPTNATHYIAFLGGRNNFRKRLSEFYKANRSSEYPKYFNLAKQYLIEEYGFIESNGFEAEDYVSWCNKYVELNLIDLKFDNVTIVREDHDLDQIAGVHYNPSKEEFTTIDGGTSEYNFWKQMLTGCSTDKVTGIPGAGEVKAKKYLEKMTEVNSDTITYSNWVLDAYVNHFGESDGIFQFALNYRQLYLLTYNNDFIREVGQIPEFPKIQQVIKPIVDEKIEF